MIKVIIVDDNKIFRQCLCELLDSISFIEVIGDAENGKIAVELVRKLKPDVVLMDIRMPVMNGIDATRQIHDEFADIKVIAFSTFLEKEIIEEMFEAGACGYLLKGNGLNQIAAAIKTVNSGEDIQSCVDFSLKEKKPADKKNYPTIPEILS
jgi:DNA-binding NarL/FixJ family response regulator